MSKVENSALCLSIPCEIILMISIYSMSAYIISVIIFKDATRIFVAFAKLFPYSCFINYNPLFNNT